MIGRIVEHSRTFVHEAVLIYIDCSPLVSGGGVWLFVYMCIQQYNMYNIEHYKYIINSST